MKCLHFHIHIIKNGGTSIKQIIAANYPTQATMDYVLKGRTTNEGLLKTPLSKCDDVLMLLSEIRLRQRNLACITTNLSYGADKFLERPIKYFTIVRDPVTRFISHYYFLHRANSPVCVDNPSVFDINRAERIDPFNRIEFCNDQLRMITGTTDTQVTEKHLDYAKQLVESGNIVVGLLEHFEGSINFIGSHLGWSNYSIPHLNAAPINMSDDSLPKEVTNRIRAANYWDIAFYQWIRDRLYKEGIISRNHH